ncbi:phytanoyl-CoA dioxygenase family protein [Orrella sp. JC864]|uniref:phytanoyl-CoA dioxygenase family protein n=1 Tax=Orrella sp. JC864 TaxID=3120298 RepID=UPI003009728F
MSKLIRWLKLPWWIVQLATGAKSFQDNPLIGSRLLNRAGLHAARVRLAHRLAASRRRRLAHLVSEADRAAFDANGYVIKTDFLPPGQFEALRAELLQTALPAREMLQGDPAWLGLLRYVGSFKLQPLCYVQTILSHVRQDDPDPQTRLHADTFHASVKAWLFLTDVAEDEGPFTYVPGSHRLTPERLCWEKARSLEAAGLDRMSARGSLRVDEHELAALGYGPPRVFAVRKNTLVVADTVGFHARGPSVRPSTRVEIWGYGRRNPFLPWTGLELGALPGIRGRTIGLYWRVKDAMEKLGARKNPWRKVGTLKAGDPARLGRQD